MVSSVLLVLVLVLLGVGIHSMLRTLLLLPALTTNLLQQ